VCSLALPPGGNHLTAGSPPTTWPESDKDQKKLALWSQNAQPLQMAKTWVSKIDRKSERAFLKAMRLLSPKNNRRQNSRPR
jgi:hypothetical protein